jgi:voltage-gated potassium channel
MRRSPAAELLLPCALMLAIPAFYLALTGPTVSYRYAGSALYGVAALLLACRLLLLLPVKRIDRVYALDLAILFGAVASAWPTEPAWNDIEWVFRLCYCAVVFIRLATVAAHYVKPHSLLQIVMLALLLLAMAGGGFLWLEPRVHSYADGLWLAFITGATVGYGDLVPSAPASRIFAVFIVLLGYALFSVLTASIAALLVGEDEKRMQRALHADLRLLRDEIAALRAELRASLPGTTGPEERALAATIAPYTD